MFVVEDQQLFHPGNFQVSRVLEEFHGAGKPQALCCIAPVIAAKVKLEKIKFAGPALSSAFPLSLSCLYFEGAGQQRGVLDPGKPRK